MDGHKRIQHPSFDPAVIMKTALSITAKFLVVQDWYILIQYQSLDPKEIMNPALFLPDRLPAAVPGIREAPLSIIS